MACRWGRLQLVRHRRDANVSDAAFRTAPRARWLALIAAGADVNARYLQKTPLDEAVLFSNPRVYSTLLRAGSALPTEQSYIREGPYFLKVRRAGGFKQYEAQVKKSLAATLVPKFPQIPAEVIPTIVEFWAHAGDY